MAKQKRKPQNVARIIERDDVKWFQDLLDAGTAIPLDQLDDDLPLQYAAEHGAEKIVAELIRRGSDVNVKAPDSHSALHKAAWEGHLNIVRMLIAAGADCNDNSYHDVTPLICALQDDSSNRVAMVDALIKAGADVKYVRPRMDSVLMQAARGGPKCTKLLLDAGADVNFTCDDGSALTEAVRSRQIESVKLLLKAGADPNYRLSKKNSFPGLTAIELALKVDRKIAALLSPVSSTKDQSRVFAKPPPLPKLWALIESDAADAKRRLMLRPPATKAQLDAAQVKVRQKLPADYLKSMQIHDGQAAKGTPILVGKKAAESYRLLPLTEVAAAYKALWADLRNGTFRNRKGISDLNVFSNWFHGAWVPFAGNGQGDYLLLDLCPVTGTKGQIITYYASRPHRRLLASSFSDWLRGVLTVTTKSK